MRCPYCGGFNVDRAVYCTSCGRDLKTPPRPAAGQQSPYSQPRPAPGQQGRPAPAPGQQGRPAAMPPGRPAAPPPQAPQQSRHQAPLPVPPPPPAPAPPAPFPPNSIAELQALEQGALPYTVVESAVGDGHKKSVRIVYAKGVAWQQVATLSKRARSSKKRSLRRFLFRAYWNVIQTFTTSPTDNCVLTVMFVWAA